VLLFDGAYSVSPNADEIREIAAPKTAAQFLKRWWMMLWNIPLWPRNSLSHRQFVAVVCLLGFLLLPVPLSRAILMDHYPEQCFAGSLIGFVEGLVWHWCIMWLRKRFNYLLGRRFLWIFVHNYGAPRLKTVNAPPVKDPGSRGQAVYISNVSTEGPITDEVS